MTKPFRFGVSSAAPSRPPRGARGAQDGRARLSTLFMPDHFGEELAPMPATRPAAHTTTLKIGALVFDNDYSSGDPCEGMATIDLLSDGRLELGPSRADEDRLRRARPRLRPARGPRRPFRRGAARDQQCFTGEKFSYNGSHTASPTTRRSPARAEPRSDPRGRKRKAGVVDRGAPSRHHRHRP